MSGRVKCVKCSARATHYPKLCLSAFAGGTPHTVILNYPVCSLHFPHVDDVLGDEGWNQLTGAILASKSLAPRRDLTRLEMIRITGAEARQFDELRRQRFAYTAPKVD